MSAPVNLSGGTGSMIIENKLTFRRCIICNKVALMSLSFADNSINLNIPFHDGDCLEAIIKKYPDNLKIAPTTPLYIQYIIDLTKKIGRS